MFTVIWTFAKASIGLSITYGLYEALRRLLHHPLSSIPGPKIAAITSLYTAYYDLVLGGELVNHLEILHQKYGPVVRIGPDQIHFNDHRAFEDIYTNSKFTKEPNFYNSMNEQESSFGYIDIRKAKQRKDVMRPLFSRRAILKLEGVIQATVDKLVAALLSANNLEGKPVNMYMGFLSTSMDIITAYCFAHSYDAVSVPGFRHPILVASESVGLIFVLIQHFPYVGPFVHNIPLWLARFLSPGSVAYAELIGSLSSQIDELMKSPEMLENAEHEIIYHHLLTSNSGKGGDIPSKKSLLHEASVMIFAGTDTVGNVCTVGTFHVLNDREIKNKLVEELKNAWPDLDTVVGYERLEKLPYLTAVIKESLRMSHGVVVPLPRVVTTPTVIAGVPIPTNTTVSMGSTFMHNNPDVFKDPLSFRPERWLGDHRRDLDSFLVPFSKGPRSCLGLNLAWCELYLIFANLFRKIYMEVYDTTVDDLKFTGSIPLRYRKPLHIQVKSPRL